MGYSFQADGAATGSVGTASIVDEAVTTPKIALSAVTTDRIADGAVVSAKMAAGVIGSTQLANDAVGSQHIAALAVGTSELADLSVTEGKLAAGAVTSGKIGTAAVGSSHIADGSVTVDELGPAAVTTAKIADLNVTEGKLAASAVTTGKIADASITSAKFAPGAVGAASLEDGSVTAIKHAAVQAFTATGTILATGGQEVRYSGATAAQTLTLPAAATGLEYRVHNIATVPVTIAAGGTEYIGGATNTSVVLAPGAKVLLIAAAAGSWYPVWDAGEQVSGAYQQFMTDISPGVAAADILQITVVGDGVTPMKFSANLVARSAGGAGTALHARLRDASGGGGASYGGDWLHIAAANYDYTLHPIGYMAPFIGSRTIYCRLAGSGNVSSLNASTGTIASLRATWEPGHYAGNPS